MWQGPHPYSGSACPCAGSPIPRPGILPEQSQISAFPQSPPHTISASGAYPHSHPVCPLGTCWVRPPRVCVALGGSGAGSWVPLWVLSPQPCQVSFQEGPQGGGPQDSGPPTVPSPLGCPPRLSLSPGGMGGCYPQTPHPPTPAEMKDGPGPPGIPQHPPSVCNWGVWCELPPLNPHLVLPGVW